MIAQKTIDVIKQLPIERVIGQYIELKRRGTNYISCCPFHDEKTPSFYVSPSKGIFKCFGCGKSGDSITFVRDHLSLTFEEAVERIAKDYNVAVEYIEDSDDAKREREVAERARNIKKTIQDYQQNKLFCSATDTAKTALDWLIKKTGFDAFKLRDLGLGFIDDLNALRTHLLGSGYTEADVDTLDLFRKDERDEMKLRFMKERVSIPVYRHGALFGWEYRALEKDAKDKYIKSAVSANAIFTDCPRSFVNAKSSFNKGCVLVEGIFDKISAEDDNVVSCGGTQGATESAIIDAIERGAKSFYVCFDNDESGRRERTEVAKRIYDIARGLKKLVSVYIAQLPSEDGSEKVDPNDYIREHGTNAFVSVIHSARPFYMVQVDEASKRLADEYKVKSYSQAESEFWNEVGLIHDSLIKIDAAECQDYINDSLNVARVSVFGDNAFAEDSEGTKARLDQLRDKRNKMDARESVKESFEKAAAMAKDGLFGDARTIIEKSCDKYSNRGEEDEFEGWRVSSKRDLDWYEQTVKTIPESLHTNLFVTECDNNGDPKPNPRVKEIIIPIGQLSLIAGRPGHGKTSMLIQLAVNLATLYPNKKVHFLTFEISETAIFGKFYGVVTGDDITEYDSACRHDREGSYKESHDESQRKFAKMAESGLRLESMNVNFTADKLARYIEYLKSKEDVCCIVVDYIQLIRAQKEFSQLSDAEQLRKVCDELRNVSLRTLIPIVAGVQYSRGIELTDDATTKLTKLGRSGELEQTANVVLSLFKVDTQNNHSKLTCQWIKNRDGENELMGVLDWNHTNNQIKPLKDCEAPIIQVPQQTQPNEPKNKTEKELEHYTYAPQDEELF